MPTQIILDHWIPSRVTWRFETHCYGPPALQGRPSVPHPRPQARHDLRGRWRGARLPRRV